MMTRKEGVNGHLLLAFALCGLALGAGAAPKYQATITASGYTGAMTLANFPVLVRISTSTISGFSYSQCKKANGADLSFVDANTNAIPHEIDTWNPEGESLVWVKVPSFAKDTTFMMRWGDDEAALVTASDTWTGYVMVWHLDDATDAKTLANSSPSGSVYDAVPRDSNSMQSLYFGTGDAAAPIGGARCISETNAHWVSFLKMTNNYSTALGTVSQFTLSTWIRATDVGSGSNWFQLFRNKASSWNDTKGFWVDTPLATQIKVVGNGATITEVNGFPTMKDNWVHVVIAYNGTKATVYGNGQKIKEVTVQSVTEHGPYLQVAAGTWGAWLDEFRFMKGTASADWVKADYDTVKTSDFLAYGKVERLIHGFMLFLR